MAVITINYFSKIMRRQSTVSVIIPTDGMEDVRSGRHTVEAGAKYQTLWLLHGGGGDHTDFINFSNIVRYADRNKMAVVMPAGIRFYEGKDYAVVTEELPALLRILLPLSERREDNFIGGLSHGGDCALRACLEHPEAYAAGLVMSAAGVDHGESSDLRFPVFDLAERDLRAGKQIPHLIFATGSGDRGFPSYTPVIDELEVMGVDLYRYFIDDEGHSWEFWDEALRWALDEYLPIQRHVILPE